MPSVSHLPCHLCHQTSQSFALPPATKPVSHLPCPLPPNSLFKSLALYHAHASPLRHCITTCHHVGQVICLAPCHQTVSHLPCPLPPSPVSQSVICLAPCHQTSQSFALPPATKPVSHLPCPLPPNQSVIWLALYHHRGHFTTILASCHCVTASPPCHPASPSHVTASPHHHITMPLHHHVTTSLHHHITVSHHCVLHHLCHCVTEIFPTTWVWIWLVNTTQHSSDWLIVPTTANQITGIEKPNYHKTLIFFPTTSLKGHMKPE